ncbi:MAG: hypothetical protein KAQ92_08835 [Candidatus Aenigmarchaeota archaeon]|nr:hypothetical protein [Candidatus Aenigmarchaeota archaeon]
MVKFEKEEIETMRKAGWVVGTVGKTYISEIYQLDRIRSAEEFINIIKNISLRAIKINSAGEKSEDYESAISKYSFTNLIEIINKYKDNFEEIKDIVLIYSTFYLGVKYKKGGKDGEKSN